MAEKADLPPDNVSLPPTYAPSEAFTESPPPAYRGAKSSRVQIVKLVCVTVVVSSVIIGFFILTSNYLNARACTCPAVHNLDRVDLLQTAGFAQPPPAAEALVGLEAVPVEAKEEEETNPAESEKDINTLDAGDDPTLGPEPPIPTQEVDALVDDVVEAEKKLEAEVEQMEEAEEEVLQDILAAQADHMKKIRLPVDLILGNPSLAGRDVNCEVERRQQPLGGGLMTQAIIVTCHDDDSDDLQPPRPIPQGPRPPLSLLAPLMKMLTSRAGARPMPLSQPPSQPRIVPVSLRGPIPIFPQGRSMSPVSLRGPFPLPTKARMSPVSIRGPVVLSQARPNSQDGPRDRMLPPHLQPVVKMTPRLLSAMPRGEVGPISLAELQRGALPKPRPRALTRPVNLPPPPFPLRPAALLPRPFNVLERFDEHHPVTHMEMRDHEEKQGQKTRDDEPERDFGPPRGHTLIATRPHFLPQAPPQSHGPRMIHLPKAIRVQSLPQEVMTPPRPIAIMPHKQPIAGPPHRQVIPPPVFAPQGIRGPVPEINPEAEVMHPHPQDLPQHLHQHQPQPNPQHEPQPHPQPQQPSPKPPTHEEPRKHHLLLVN